MLFSVWTRGSPRNHVIDRGPDRPPGRSSFGGGVILGHIQTIFSALFARFVPSVLWRCWLGVRKGIRPVKNWVVGCWCDYLYGASCRLALWPSWWHCHSLSLASVKSRLGLAFWYRLTRVVLDKGPLNRCVYSQGSAVVWPMATGTVAISYRCYLHYDCDHYYVLLLYYFYWYFVLLRVSYVWVVWCVSGMLIRRSGTTRTSSCLRFSAYSDGLGTIKSCRLINGLWIEGLSVDAVVCYWLCTFC